jgi:hypothetical protein
MKNEKSTPEDDSTNKRTAILALYDDEEVHGARLGDNFLGAQ